MKRYLLISTALIAFAAPPASASEENVSRSPDVFHSYMVVKKEFTKESCTQHAYDLMKSAVGEIATKDDGGASASDSKFTVVIACAPPKTVFFFGAGPQNDSDELSDGLAKLMKDFQGPNCHSCTEKK